jgi:hypothetical protein
VSVEQTPDGDVVSTANHKCRVTTAGTPKHTKNNSILRCLCITWLQLLCGMANRHEPHFLVSLLRSSPAGACTCVIQWVHKTPRGAHMQLTRHAYRHCRLCRCRPRSRHRGNTGCRESNSGCYDTRWVTDEIRGRWYYGRNSTLDETGSNVDVRYTRRLSLWIVFRRHVCRTKTTSCAARTSGGSFVLARSLHSYTNDARHCIKNGVLHLCVFTMSLNLREITVVAIFSGPISDHKL